MPLGHYRIGVFNLLEDLQYPQEAENSCNPHRLGYLQDVEDPAKSGHRPPTDGKGEHHRSTVEQEQRYGGEKVDPPLSVQEILLPLTARKGRKKPDEKFNRKKKIEGETGYGEAPPHVPAPTEHQGKVLEESLDEHKYNSENY